ncbi:MAG: glycosyltransferase family 4 protein [Eubacteriaceae bacterium]|nr:glycosyltransferase family 4 protein [Eubacteriaceae bacterium]
MVYSTKIKADDGCNLLIRTQFGGWPKNKLAQIHSTAEPNGCGDYCCSYFKISDCDRRYGKLFFVLRKYIFKYSKHNSVSDAISYSQKGYTDSIFKNILRKIKVYISGAIVNSGFWEVIFAVRLSESMKKFIEDFKPDIIYCQGYSLSFTVLPLLISKKYDLPICFQTTDDWPNERYKNSPVSYLIKKKARELITNSEARMSFGKKMTDEYRRRYNIEFENTYHLDDINRFDVVKNCVQNDFTIIYTGLLSLRRYEAIQDLLKAVRSIKMLKGKVFIRIYTNGIPVDMPEELIKADEITYQELPRHDELPKILKKASLLFLPESFNVDRSWLEYSISTKSHLYMMSGKPILVYGPKYSGTIEYASQEKWAFVVNEKNISKIEEKVRFVLLGGSVVEAQINRARNVALRNHDIFQGRMKFERIIADAAKKYNICSKTKPSS